MLSRMVLLFVLLMLAQGREIRGLDTRQLSIKLAEPAFFPSYSTDGQSIYFTHGGYQGLWQLDRSRLTIYKISAESGAGYEPLPLSDGSLVYRRDSYVDGRKYTALMRFADGHSYELTEAERFLTPLINSQNALIYLAGTTVKVLNLQSEAFETPRSDHRAVFNERLALQILNQNSLNELRPAGDGNYIWAQLSPEGERIVFTRVSDGSYICDLEGNILAKLGSAHAPRWSPDGEFICYMRDSDDGSRFTASEIWISSADGSQSWQITQTPERIELYPRWAPAGDRIAYHTPLGELFETSLEIVK